MDDDEVHCPQCGWRPLLPVERINGVVPLDDVLWSQLETAYGNGVEILACLRRIEAAAPEEAMSLWLAIDGWGAFLHQGSVYEGSFAGVPHLVRLAAKLPPENAARHELLVLVGGIAGDGGISIAQIERTDWRQGYMPECVRAMKRALPLIVESLATRPDETTVRWLLAAIAGICGYGEMWHGIQNMDDEFECAFCGKTASRNSDV